MRIGFCGTMSVGKTTLVKALEKTGFFNNYDFRTERSKYLSSLGIPLNTDSTLKGQTIFLAERTSELILEKVVTDRTVLDVMAFTNNAKSISVVKAEMFEEYASLFLGEYDYMFYVSPKGVEIENNGIRETDEEYRHIIDRSIRSLLVKYGKNIRSLTTIEGSTEERVKTVINTIRADISLHNESFFDIYK